MRQIFGKKVRAVLLAAVLLTIVLSVAASALNFTLPDVTVKTVLQPLRSGAQALTRQAEGIYSYLFRYEALEEQVRQLERRTPSSGRRSGPPPPWPVRWSGSTPPWV